MFVIGLAHSGAVPQCQALGSPAVTLQPPPVARGEWGAASTDSEDKALRALPLGSPAAGLGDT